MSDGLCLGVEDVIEMALSVPHKAQLKNTFIYEGNTSGLHVGARAHPVIAQGGTTFDVKDLSHNDWHELAVRTCQLLLRSNDVNSDLDALASLCCLMVPC
jgi:hypothetical protein